MTVGLAHTLALAHTSLAGTLFRATNGLPRPKETSCCSANFPCKRPTPPQRVVGRCKAQSRATTCVCTRQTCVMQVSIPTCSLVSRDCYLLLCSLLRPLLCRTLHCSFVLFTLFLLWFDHFFSLFNLCSRTLSFVPTSHCRYRCQRFHHHCWRKRGHWQGETCNVCGAQRQV